MATSLAEQDQERLRSFRPVDLATYNLPARIVKVPAVTGVPYTVASQVDWITDAADGTTSCTSEANQEDYLRITSTVTSGIIGKQTKPVTQRSLVAPPVGAFRQGQGTLVVQVTGKTLPVTNMPVTITKPGTTVTDDTNAYGCAVFRYVPVGSYTVSFSKAGYVDPGGINLMSRAGTVSEGTVNLTSFTYDKAASVVVSFDTSVPATAHATAIPPAVTPLPGATLQARSWSIVAEHTDDPTSGARAYPSVASTTLSTTKTATNLYPFPSAYSLYAGACKGANPALLSPAVPAAGIAPGFAKAPGGLDPGELLYPLTVRMPSLNIKVVSNAAATTPVMGGNVIVTPTSNPDCPALQPKVAMKTWSNALATDPNRGWATKQVLPLYTVFDPGMPYGTYSVCADDGSKRKTVASLVSNNNAAGSTPITINLSSGTTASKCAFP